MGEAAIFEVREVRGVVHCGLYTGPSGIVLLKTLFDLVSHARARIYGRDGDIRLKDGAISR
jgi:hypothetical protein